MKLLLKLFLVLFVAFIAVIALTWLWFQRIAAKAGPGAIDILYVVTRPQYVLELLVILALAAWVCWRWAFA